jgi:hypothetical protein
MGSEYQRSHARREPRHGAYIYLGIDCLGLKRVGAERCGARGAPPRGATAEFKHLGDGHGPHRVAPQVSRPWLHDTLKLSKRLSRTSARDESRSGRIGPIGLGREQPGERRAGKSASGVRPCRGLKTWQGRDAVTLANERCAMDTCDSCKDKCRVWLGKTRIARGSRTCCVAVFLAVLQRAIPGASAGTS